MQNLHSIGLFRGQKNSYYSAGSVSKDYLWGRLESEPSTARHITYSSFNSSTFVMLL